MKLGICEWNIPVVGLEARFQWAAEAGLKAVEIDLENAGGNEPLVTELAKRWQIGIPTLGINACCKNSMCDPAQRPIIESAFRAAVDTALALSIPKLQVPSFAESWIETDEDFEQTIDCYRFLCGLVRGTGLMVGTENALTAEKQLELLEQVGSDQLKIYFDTRNAFAMSGLHSADILEQLYPHVCEVHLKDGTDNGPSQPLGKGNSGFFPCLEILRDHGYNGWILLENDYESVDACKTDMETAVNGFKS